MRIITKSVKIIGLTKDELPILQDLLQDARQHEKSKEVQVGFNQYLAVEVSDIYRQVSSAEREHMRRGEAN